MVACYATDQQMTWLVWHDNRINSNTQESRISGYRKAQWKAALVHSQVTTISSTHQYEYNRISCGVMAQHKGRDIVSTAHTESLALGCVQNLGRKLSASATLGKPSSRLCSRATN